MYGGSRLTILTGHVGANGWCRKSVWSSLNRRARLVLGSSFSLSRAHTMHFKAVAPLVGQLCVWWVPEQYGHMGAILHAAAVCPTSRQLKQRVGGGGGH